MVVKEMKPLSMAEAKTIVDAVDKSEKGETEEEVSSYLKKFTKIKGKDAEKMRKEFEDLDIIKLKPRHIAKIIDILPEDAIDVNKINPELSLNQDEINKILEITKKYK